MGIIYTSFHAHVHMNYVNKVNIKYIVMIHKPCESKKRKYQMTIIPAVSFDLPTETSNLLKVIPHIYYIILNQFIRRIPIIGLI